jgi:hypothetical protein
MLTIIVAIVDVIIILIVNLKYPGYVIVSLFFIVGPFLVLMQQLYLLEFEGLSKLSV